MPKRKRKARTQFTESVGRCMLVTVETVFELKDTEAAEEVLEELRRNGAAVVLNARAI